ncbi:NADH dehydrogenase [ubiquinone] 1 alpha subcomplex subunit 6-like [Dysidea avara]|uniref:NADH dehydrogenase [ubiquinone] 1 alpha subcomplex subunit 6-like n=1 Tax=Dysidea avara TaxID=196820 RepID=UPI003321C6E1
MASQLVKAVASKQAKPASVSFEEARKRVLNVYRAWYRELPRTCEAYALDVSIKQARGKLREEFMKNAHVRDPRVIDLLVFKAQNDLYDTYQIYASKTHLMRYFHETETPKRTDFLTRFYEGKP